LILEPHIEVLFLIDAGVSIFLKKKDKKSKMQIK